MVCLIAQMMLSMNNLNCGGGMPSRAVKRLVKSDNTKVESRTRETIEVYCPEQLEEANTMFWELGEVLINHVQCRFEDCVKNGRNLGCQQRLQI